jgi:hypothetical protein
MLDLLPPAELPNGFAYPAVLVQRVADGDLDVGPCWQILTRRWLGVRNEGLRKRFPERRLIPFARRLDNDDIACWDVGDSMRVHIVHDFAAPGWEQRESYANYDEWSRAALDDAEDCGG